MYSDSTQTRIPFTRVEQPHIAGLSPNALRVYATTRSFANGHGKVTGVYQDQMAGRAGLGRTRFIQGLREAEKADAVVTDYDRWNHEATYTFPKSGSKFAAIPNPVLVRALKELRAREFQVLVALYLHVDTKTGITWVSTSTLSEELDMPRPNVSRALRNIQDLFLVRLCTDHTCGTRTRHWHLTTHKTCAVCTGITDLNHIPNVGCPRYGNSSVQGANMVTEDECPQDDFRVVGREDQEEKKRRPLTRALRAQGGNDAPPARGEEISPIGASYWGMTEPEPVAKQTVLAKELLAAIASIKPGIVWKGPDYSMMTKWFNERLDHGWTVETCRRAIEMFIEDPGTVLAIGEKRPTVAFMGFVRKREAQFSETVTKQLREVQDDYENAVRRVAEKQRLARERAAARRDVR